MRDEEGRNEGRKGKGQCIDGIGTKLDVDGLIDK